MSLTLRDKSVLWAACLAVLFFLAAGVHSRAEFLVFEAFGENVPDNSPISGAPGWRAIALNGGLVTDYTTVTPNGNYPSMSHLTAGAGSSGIGYLVLGAGNTVSNVFVWVGAATNLQGKLISDISFYSRNNAAVSTERIAIRAGGQWHVSTAAFNDAGGASTWTLNTFAFTTNASAWQVFNTNTLSLGAVLSSPLPAGITAVGLFGQIQPDPGKIRVDEFLVNGFATNSPPVISGLAVTPSTNLYTGASATLTASVSGTPPLSFQWRRNGVNLTNTSNISGATTASLVLSNAQASQSGGYSVVVTNTYGAVTSSLVPLTVAIAVPATVDLSGYQAGNSVAVTQPDTNTLSVQWTNSTGNRFRAQFNLTPGQALLRSVETAPPTGLFVVTAQNVDARYRVTAGSRFQKTGAPYVFFDTVDANSPAPIAYLSQLDPRLLRVESESSNRVKLVFSDLDIGPFTGELTCFVYTGSPFLHFQASMNVDRPWLAYIYDAVFFANFANVAYKDINGASQTVAAATLSETAPGDAAKIFAKHRVIFGTVTGGTGTLAVMSAPHLAVYPTDFSNNYGYEQAGKTFIGTHMSPNADGRYRPWIDAPIGSTQRMDVFLVISTNTPSAMLTNQVLPYTHGDVFKSLPGYYTMAEHFHPEFTTASLGGGDTLTPFRQAMQSIGVQILQLMEFHGPGHPFNDLTNRLAELRQMFSLFQTNSDNSFLLVPGEEYNNFFGGHWSYMFRAPVYFTGWSSQGSRPYRLTNTVAGGVTYPLVYQVGDADHLSQLLQDEGGIAWTSHPRVKASAQTPDTFVNTDFYRDPSFQAGDWKVMPVDLSKDRLGYRSFSLMDETAQWGYRKAMLGEVDTFALNPTHEMYAHMNVNYLQLPVFPSKTNWGSVVDCILNGEFFTTTGEILVHSWSASTTGVTATVEWYFPPAFAEITWGDAEGVHKLKQMLAGETEFQTKAIVISADLSGADWVRFEAWDVARNGAFTQIRWLKPPSNPPMVTGKTLSFTLIDADTDAPVAGYDPLPEGAVLSRDVLPPNLTLRANISPLRMDSVVLQLDGAPVTRTQWPYSLGTCTTGPGIGDSPTYDYAASLLNAGNHVITATPRYGTNSGESLTRNFSVVNSSSPPTNFVMDGVLDSLGYQLAGGLGLYAAVQGTTLYVAAPATDTNDQFMLISDVTGSLGPAPWSKAGQVACDVSAKPFLAQSGATKSIFWTNAGAQAASSALDQTVMEGTLDLLEAFGAVPSSINLALLRYAPGAGGSLLASKQLPPGNGNGNVEAAEFVRVPVSQIQDGTLNGVLDVLEPGSAFTASFSNNPGVFVVRWPAIPGYTYRVFAVEDLSQPFLPLSGAMLAGPGVFTLSYTDAPPPAISRRFYRAVRLISEAHLLARFQFEGDGRDSGPNALPTTATGLAYTNDSAQGGLAGSFDGTNAVVQSGTANPVTGSFSLSLWLKTSSGGAGSAGDQWFNGTGLVDADTPGVATDWGLALTGGSLAFGIGGGSAGANLTITSPAVNNGIWHHVVAAWDQGSGQITLYVDGAVAASALSNSSEPRTGASPLIIGKNSTAARYYRGFLDDIQVYDRVLTSGEVSFLQANPGVPLR